MKRGPTYPTKILRPVEPFRENQIWKSYSKPQWNILSFIFHTADISSGYIAYSVRMVDKS
jgi:hypothetical protein